LSTFKQRILNEIQRNAQQSRMHDSDLLKSRYNSNNMLDKNDDNYDDDINLRGDVYFYCVLTLFSDVIHDKKFKKACKNRLREYFIETYNESFINVYLTGRQVIRKLIIILSAKSALITVYIDPYDELKRNEKAMTFIFHSYNSQAIRIGPQTIYK
jgi:hypothetical protein